MKTPQRFVSFVLICVALLAVSATPAFASHFRYGSITWRTPNQNSPRTVEFNVQLAFRRSFFGAVNVGNVVQPGTLDFGDNQSTFINLIVTSVDITNDWITGQATITHTYANPGTYKAQHFNCCRLSTLQNNHDTNWDVTTEVVIPPSGTVNQPPSSSMLPIITVAANAVNTIQIPATDPENDTLTYSLATATDMGGAGSTETQPPGLSINPTTGIATFNTIGRALGLWDAQFKICDVQTAGCSGGRYVVVDVLFNVITITNNLPPTCLIDGQATPQTFNVQTGVPATFTVSATDPENGPITLQWTGQSGATMNPALPTVATNPSSTFTWTPTNADSGAHVISFSCTDNVGQQRTNSATVNVNINHPPTVSAGTDFSVAAGDGCVAPITLSGTASDPDGDPITYSWTENGTVINTTPSVVLSRGPGAHTFVLAVSDDHGHTTTSSVTVTVTTAPSITVAPSFTVEATGAGGATFDPNAAATVSDSCDANATLTSSPSLPNNLFPIGTTTMTYTAADHATPPNTAVAATIVTVQDTTAPSVTVPANATVEATASNGAVFTFASGATDVVDGTDATTCSPASGATFAIGTTTVSCSATDAHGNTGTASFTVTVQDTTPPTVTVPANATIEATSPNGALFSFTSSATDAVDGTEATTCSPASGSTFAVGTTTVNCSATDGHGNKGTGSFTVTVRDTTPPAVTVPANATIEATGPGGAAFSFATSATDAVDGTDSTTCSPASGSTFPIGTTPVNCSATDAHGNKGTSSFTVTVRDTTPPALVLPANATVEATSANGAVLSFTATATDRVDGADAVTCSPASGSTFPIGTTPVNCSATDAHGNSAAGSFTVTVRDTTPPVIASATPSTASIWPPNHEMVPVTIAVSATDNSGAAACQIDGVTSNEPVSPAGDWIIAPHSLSLELRADRLGNGNGRIYTITVSCADSFGNTSTQTTAVTVPHDQGK